MNDLWINRKEWLEFDEKQTDDFIDAVFKHYRTYGFPFFPTDDRWRKKEWHTARRYDFTRLIKPPAIRQSMHGLALCWSFMPHSWNIVCNDKKTPMDRFLDDYDFREVIRRRVKIGANMSDNGIRKMLKIFTNTQSVSNFRPTAAAALYSRYASRGVVWDMSAGFGGRMLGANIANVYYIGTDPSTQTYNGLVELANFIGTVGELVHDGSENFIPDRNSLDFCFTSPPYFDTEKYSNEPTQSYLKFPTVDEWLDGYLKQTVLNCRTGLKKSGRLALNVANVKSVPDLERLVHDAVTECGFELEHKWMLMLSTLSAASAKHEPILVYRKRK